MDENIKCSGNFEKRKCRMPVQTGLERNFMNIKFAKGIDICIEDVHIQKWSGVKSAGNNLYLLSMDDGIYYLFDLNNKIIQKYDDYDKLPDILKDDV